MALKQNVKKITIEAEERGDYTDISFNTDESPDDTVTIIILGLMAIMNIPEDKAEELCDYLMSMGRKDEGEPKYVN